MVTAWQFAPGAGERNTEVSTLAGDMVALLPKNGSSLHNAFCHKSQAFRHQAFSLYDRSCAVPGTTLPALLQASKLDPGVMRFNIVRWVWALIAEKCALQ